MAEPPLEFGDRTIEHRDVLSYAPTALRASPRLTWTDANGPHTVVVARRMLLGSATAADVQIADPTISRLHAEAEPRADGLWIRDLGSRNGTFVQGLMVGVARLPAEGAQIQLGSTRLVLQYEREPTAVELWPQDRFGPLVGRSDAMRELFAQLDRVAATDASVLIQGETGTGKELVARAIHEASGRAGQPYVIVDCAALPENLLESELFGHVKGAFTGAQTTRTGAIEAADGGTVFLDEIGELPLAMQPKLLRVLESRTVRRLGETQSRRVDVRFVSATHRDLGTMVNAGAFREDLYFRLAVLPVVIPPLRARPEDIPLLVEHFASTGRPASLGPDVIAALAQRPWLGNVRELRNFIERVRALGAEKAMAFGATQPPPPPSPAGRTASLPPPPPAAARAAATRPPPPPARPASATEAPALTADQTLKEVREAWSDYLEREYIRKQVERHGRNVNAIAQAAGIDRTYVYRLMRRYEL